MSGSMEQELRGLLEVEREGALKRSVSIDTTLPAWRQYSKWCRCPELRKTYTSRATHDPQGQVP